MKKNLNLLLVTILILTFSSGCSNPQKPKVVNPKDITEKPGRIITDKVPYKDGIYFAPDEYFASSGWKANVTVTVENGFISKVLWNGISIVPVEDKLTYSLNGNYDMVNKGKAKSEWHVQAKITEDYILSTQNLDPEPDFYKDAKGHTDAIAGVTITVSELYKMMKDALASGPLEKGPLTDGYPYASLDTDQDGWQDKLQYVIVEGNIVDVNYNSFSTNQVDKKNKPLNKKILQDAYDFPEKSSSDKAWYMQAIAVEKYIIANQGFNKEILDKNGYTDKIEGVTINLRNLSELADKILE